MTATAASSAAIVEAIRQKAKRLSILSMMSTTAAGSGHPTSCMSAAELVAGTFFYAMKIDPKNPNSPDGDRFVLSKGHAAPVLHAALAEAGVFPESRLMTLREFSSELEGHPTPRIPGVDAATGSLGQGLSVGSGLAFGARVDKSPTRVYVLMGDGEMAEGQVWEAAAFAAHYNLDNVTVIGAGVTLHEALKAADQLKAEATAVRVIDLYCVKPIDGKELAREIAATGGRLITVEDHRAEGGIGERCFPRWLASPPAGRVSSQSEIWRTPACRMSSLTHSAFRQDIL
jgi:transketolase N-terminal domain/subunit